MINLKKSFLFFFIFLLSIIHNTSLASEIENIKIGPFFLGQKYTLSEFGKYKNIDTPNFKNTNFNFKNFNDNRITDKYDRISIGYWKDEKKIVMIQGFINYPNKLQKCLNKKQEVTESIKQSFSSDDYKISHKDLVHSIDRTKKSRQYSTALKFSDGIAIVISCLDWSKHIEKKMQQSDGLSVEINYSDESFKVGKLMRDIKN